MTQRAITPAREGQLDSILQLINQVGKDELRRLGLSKDDAQRLLEKGGDFKSELVRLLSPIVQRYSAAPNIVVVPDMGAVELTAATNRDLRLTYLDRDYAAWDFHTGLDGQPIAGRGLKFEAIIFTKKDIKPSDDDVSSEEVRAYFRERGYFGHTGAFTQWRRQNPTLMGYHASIPEDNGCWRGSDGRLCVPYSYFGEGCRELYRYWFADDWDDRGSFVAFRVVS
jgi:hypothetical protein